MSGPPAMEEITTAPGGAPLPAWAEARSPLAVSREKVAISTLNQSRLNRLLAMASQQYRMGKYKEAEQTSMQIYQIDACWLDNLLLLGAVHFQLRNFSECIFYNQQAIRVDRNFAESYSNLGNALKELGDIDGAVQAYLKAIKLKPRFCDAYNNLASAYAQLGKADQAIETYKMALVLNPALADAHSNLGNLYKAQGKLEEAKKCYLEAIRIQPEFAIAWSNLGGIFKEEKDLKTALAYYKEAIRLMPEFADAHSNLASALKEAGMIKEAREAYQEAIRLRPDFAIAHGNLGNCHFDQGDVSKAISCYKHAIQLEPNFPDAYNNLGNAMREQGNIDEAIACYRTALRLKVDHPHAYNNLGNALKDKGLVKEAVHCYTTACRLMPQFPEAQNNLGSLLKEQGKLHQAIAHYQEAIAVDNHFAEAYSNMGNSHKELGQMDLAIKCYTMAIKIKPGFADAYCNLAGAFMDVRRFDDAITCYKKSLELRPNFPIAFASLCHAQAAVGDWSQRKENQRKLHTMLEEELEKENVLPCLQPFYALQYDFSLEQLQHLAMKYALSVRNGVALMGMPSFRFRAKKPHARLRIGYVSSNFGNHPISHMLASVLASHDRANFEVFCYALSADDESSWRRRIQEKTEHFKDVSELSYVDIARLIHADGVHICVDLNGFTKGSCTQIFALQPAPIQVSYLGYAGTLGADFMHYIFADAVAAPLKFEDFYCEKIVHLPGSYVVSDHKASYLQTVLDKEKLPSRNKYGIPETKFVFCNFASANKLSPKIFEVWMKILKRTPNALLWLLRFPAPAEERLFAAAEKHNIRRSRIRFSEVVPKEDHIKRCFLADVYLDTLNSTATTTACDMLWSGTPIITMLGQKMAARTCASILESVGLGDLVVKTLQEYEETAVKLASDLDRIWNLRNKLEQSRQTSTLFDYERHCRGMEKAFKMIWRKHEWGERPDHITVPAVA